MPRQMPTTPGPRILRSSPRRKPPPHVPNRRPRFPTSTPPPGPSAHPSGFSIRSQQGSISFNPAAFKAPVRTSVATEFNSGERIYSSTKSRSPSIGKSPIFNRISPDDRREEPPKAVATGVQIRRGAEKQSRHGTGSLHRAKIPIAGDAPCPTSQDVGMVPKTTSKKQRKNQIMPRNSSARPT